MADGFMKDQPTCCHNCDILEKACQDDSNGRAVLHKKRNNDVQQERKARAGEQHRPPSCNVMPRGRGQNLHGHNIVEEEQKASEKPEAER
mmetsp:Transcript_87455/g.154802  ORF Transcript_87455/g.154802 Transcript_87455/m.154802 type:complete len:90 (+) Transcript_87455:269-538(+)